MGITEKVRFPLHLPWFSASLSPAAFPQSSAMWGPSYTWKIHFFRSAFLTPVTRKFRRFSFFFWPGGCASLHSTGDIHASVWRNIKNNLVSVSRTSAYLKQYSPTLHCAGGGGGLRQNLRTTALWRYVWVEWETGNLPSENKAEVLFRVIGLNCSQ